MSNHLNIALEYHAAGLHIIPVYQDGGSVKFPDAWAKYRDRQTEQDIKDLFSTPCTGLALLCVNGIEAIDIDTKNDDTGTLSKDFFALLNQYEAFTDALPNLVMQRTKSGGYHIIYRVAEPGRNEKLAIRPTTESERAVKDQKEKTMIETRAQGGLLFIHPTPGYKVLRGVMTGIKEIPQATRNMMINAARAFSRPTVEQHNVYKSNSGSTSNGTRPGDAFNESNEILPLLEAYGWSAVGQHGGYTRMNRPGAQHARGIDGCISSRPGEIDLFYPWSTSTIFPKAEQWYSAFQIYALYEHNGDFTAAAKDLYERGFGDRMEQVKGKQQEEKQEQHKNELLARVLSTRFDIHQEITEEDADLTVLVHGKEYKVGSRGMLGMVVGEQKSGKSLISQCVTASGLCGGAPRLKFKLSVPGNIHFYDTEQSDFFYKITQRRIYQLAGMRDNAPRYAAFHLRGEKKRDRVAAIEQLISGQRIDLLVIDGVVDLCDDFMDSAASEETVDLLMEWSRKTGALLLGVLHVTKGNGYMRGHLGTALQNKCDFAIEVKKDRELNRFSVISRESRFPPFPSFDFGRDEYGMPVEDDPEDDYQEPSDVEEIFGPAKKQQWDEEFWSNPL